jgi:hypothetical protein
MRRTLFVLACAAVLALPAAAAARAQTPRPAAGFLVVRNASTDGSSVTGRPVATIVVGGFVIGRVAQEGRIQVYRLRSSAGSLPATATGVDVSRRAVTYHSHGVAVPGTEFSGSNFRFRAVGGIWRVVVYGAGVSLYAAGVGPGRASLHGSVYSPGTDGVYSFNGERFASLPAGVVTRPLGTK